MTLAYSTTFRDRFAFVVHYLPRNPVILVVAAGILLLITFSAVGSGSVLRKVFAIILVEMFFFLSIIASWLLKEGINLISPKNKMLYCDRTITLAGDFFLAESPYGKAEVRWIMVQKLARTRRHIFIYLSSESALVIPRRVFENSMQWDAFYNLCQQGVKRAG